MGQVLRWNELAEENMEKIIELEEEIWRLRNMIERIGREKRICGVTENKTILFAILIILIIDLLFGTYAIFVRQN